MENWLPYSKKPPAKQMANYNSFFSPNNTGFYAVGGDVKVKQHSSEGARVLMSANPLVKEGFVDYPKAYEALQYGFGKGVRNKPLANVPVQNNGRSQKQVDGMDASNYYNFIK
jgi:hypothetical protein